MRLDRVLVCQLPRRRPLGVGLLWCVLLLGLITLPRWAVRAFFPALKLSRCRVCAAIKGDGAGGFSPGQQPNYWASPWDEPLEMAGSFDAASGTVTLSAPISSSGALQASPPYSMGPRPHVYPLSHPGPAPPPLAAYRRLQDPARPPALASLGPRRLRPVCGAATHGAQAPTWRRRRRPMCYRS